MTCLWLVPTCLATQRVYKQLSRAKQKSISSALFFVPAMKEREDTEKKKRLHDAEGYTQRAGCLCFKTESEKEVCTLCELCYTVFAASGEDKVGKIGNRRKQTIQSLCAPHRCILYLNTVLSS